MNVWTYVILALLLQSVNPYFAIVAFGFYLYLHTR